MEDKYNQLNIAQYSRKLAKQLCDAHFSGNETIDGPALINFTPVKQINLFVIKELLVSWNREMANLKSPYFNFEDEAVKEALKQFMNVLSRKISIRREHFEPLLEQAITDTFKLVLQPAEILEEKFLQNHEEVTPEKLQEHLKYIELNKTVFSDFTETLHPIVYDKKAVSDKFRLFLKAQFHGLLSINDLLALLNPLLPISKSDIQESKPAYTQTTPASALPQPSEGVHNPSPSVASEPVIKAKEPKLAPVPASGPVGAPVADIPKKETPEAPQIKPEPIAAPAPQPAIPAQPVIPVQPLVSTQPVSSPQPVIQQQPVVQQQPVMPPSPNPEPVSTAPGTPEVRLFEKFKTEKTTLNETLRKPETGSIAAQQDNRKVETLKESISINQRFSFINELFTGENRDYHDAIAKLDSFPDADSAKNYLLVDLANKHKWVKKEEHINKLVRLIERKFS